MSLDDTSQKRAQARRGQGGQGEAPDALARGDGSKAAPAAERSGTGRLMEEMLERGNLIAALKRVEQNKGSAGDAEMIKRWVAAGFLEAEKSFRKIQGVKDLWMLKAALHRALDAQRLDDVSKAA